MRKGKAVALATALLTTGGALVATGTPATPLEAASSTVTVVAVGDMCGSACDQTAKLASAINPTAVLTAGDNAYSSGTLSEYRSKYDPYWGKFKDITYPSPGNHEYETTGAAGYFDYYGARAGTRGKGYYSVDIGDWHFVALNSNLAMTAGSDQEKWLRADLAANTKPCTAAYWHHPLFSRGDHGDNTKSKPVFQALYDNRADLVIVGHDHDYERFAPARPDGTRDDVNGVRQLVIGTGGTGLRPLANSTKGPSEKANDKTFGIGKLTLTSTSYTAEFVPVSGSSFTDKVSGDCHKAVRTPDFGISVDPAAVSVRQGGSGTTQVTVSSLNGFNSATALSASDLPAGVTATFEPSTVTPTGSARLTLTATESAAVGATTVTITGKSGDRTHSTNLQLTVAGAGSAIFADDFETNLGWTSNPAGTDTAVTGGWERGDPEPTFSTKSNQAKQLGDPPSGVNSLVTGRLAGTIPGEHDVDGGVTTVRSPAVALPGPARLSFKYNLAYDDSGPDDYLRVRVIDGATVTTVFEKTGTTANVAGGWQDASADLSAFAGKTVRLQVEAADVGATSLFEAQVDDVRVDATNTSTVFADDYESDKGWTVNAAGTDTATTGMWERGDPDQTANAVGVKQLGSTPSGSQCLSTGRLAGSGYGANDLDGGVTSIRSPEVAVPQGTSRLSFAYSVAHDVNSGADDYLRLRVVDGATVTTVFERLGTAQEVAGAWSHTSVDLSAYAGRTVRIQAEAADAGPPSLFEAQVDDIAIVNG